MARFKPYVLDQGKFSPVSFRDQTLPGSVEYTLNEIVDEHLDVYFPDAPGSGRCVHRCAAEPVFANLQNKWLKRFTLRSWPKVHADWTLFTLAHKIEKIADCGAG